jgi:hypothetical protein
MPYLLNTVCYGYRSVSSKIGASLEHPQRRQVICKQESSRFGETGQPTISDWVDIFQESGRQGSAESAKSCCLVCKELRTCINKCVSANKIKKLAMTAQVTAAITAQVQGNLTTEMTLEAGLLEDARSQNAKDRSHIRNLQQMVRRGKDRTEKLKLVAKEYLKDKIVIGIVGDDEQKKWGAFLGLATDIIERECTDDSSNDIQLTLLAIFKETYKNFGHFNAKVCEGASIS